MATTPAPAPGHLSVALSNPAYRVRQIIHASRSRTTPIRATHLARPVRRHSPIQRSNPPTHSGFAQDGAGEAKCIHSGSIPYSSRYASTNAVMTWGGGRAPPGWNTPMPCAGSRSPAAALGSRAPVPSDPKRSALVSSRTTTLVAFGLPYPLAQYLIRAADLLSDRPDRLPLRLMIRLVLKHHEHRSFSDLRGVLVRRTQGSLLSSHRLSVKPGTVHTRYSSIHGWRAEV